MNYQLQSFEEDVLNSSHDKPVVVDFWAPWCGPCQFLGPVIEKLADEQRDKWTLVKINSDEHQDLSARYSIRGIPAVKLFYKGEVIDEFTGALPETAIRQWLEKALPSETKKMIREADNLIEEGHSEKAVVLLEKALKEEPTNAEASGLLAGLLAFENTERAAELAKTAATGEARFLHLSDSIATIKACLNPAVPTNEAALRTDSKSEDVDPPLGWDEYALAKAALGEGRLSDVIDHLIEVIKVNRYLDDDGPRKLGIAIFALLGPTHPITQEKRRTFDMWLY